jgi:hypothetical protein
MLLMIPTHGGLPNWDEPNWVHSELFFHLYELFKLKIKEEVYD